MTNKIEERKKRALKNTLKLMAAHPKPDLSDEHLVISNPIIEREMRRVKQDSLTGNIDAEYIERLIKRSLRWTLKEIPTIQSDLFALLKHLGTNASMSSLEHTLVSHPHLCEHLINVANKSVSNRARVSSVRSAMVRLGITVLKQELYQAILEHTVFNNKRFGIWTKKIKFRTFASSKFALEIINLSNIKIKEEEDIFLNIFLHDIGEAYILQIIDLMQIKIFEEDIYDVVTNLHAEVGAELLNRLRMKTASLVALKHHHILSAAFPYPVILAAATDQLAFKFKLSVPPKWKIEPSDLPYRMLGLSKKDIKTLYLKAEEILEDLLENSEEYGFGV